MRVRKRAEEKAEAWLTTAAAVGAAIVVRKAVTWIWEAVTHEEPPANPAEPGVPWRQAVAWSAAVGAAVGLARMLGQRGATSAVERGKRRFR